jgi:hypothetical protein
MEIRKMENENKQVQAVANSTTELDTIGASSKLRAMMEFVKASLKEGNDYMSIAGGKPTILKSGAEKMNILMGYFAYYEQTKEIMNPKEKFYFVQIKCTLKDRQGNIVAECLASCNNQEKARKNLEFADSLNTVLKMAEKRAYVGATLNANALSQFYTQDLEDDSPVETKKVDSSGAVLSCLNCGRDVTSQEASYSSKYFQGKTLCRDCQKKVKEAQ